MKTIESLAEAARDFLDQKRIAVAGVSRTKTGEAANLIYRKLRDSGYEVFAVNPNAHNVEGDVCYPNLAAIPGGVDGVVVCTHPRISAQVASECAELGIGRVWLHRSFGGGSVSGRAVAVCREAGLRVIAGGCPMMFCPPVDLGHRCMRFVLRWTGGLPEAA